MKQTATALDSFAHGARKYVTGDPVEATPGELDDLRNAGLVSMEDAAPQTGVTDSQETDDLLGDSKAEPAPQNKMEKAPANKGKK